jgi:hypothetical protein
MNQYNRLTRSSELPDNQGKREACWIAQFFSACKEKCVNSSINADSLLELNSRKNLLHGQLSKRKKKNLW